MESVLSPDKLINATADNRFCEFIEEVFDLSAPQIETAAEPARAVASSSELPPDALGGSAAFEPQVFEQSALASQWDRRVNTINAMESEGGSFVRALAHAARMADDSNYEKLKAAFPDYWEKYEAPY